MKNTSIIIVEDETIIAEGIKDILTDLGYRMTSIVNSGEKAIEKIKMDKADLVLMDISLEGEMDGIEAADTITSRFNTPVVFLTAHAEHEYVEQAKLTHPYGYLIKPVQELDLRVSIEMALYSNKLEKARREAEQKLERSERRYREIVQAANSIIIKFDLEGKITFMNQFAKDFFGFEEEEILGRNILGTIVPETDSSGRDLEKMMRDILKNPDNYVTNENENILKSGESVWVSWSNKATIDVDGNVSELLSVGHDITIHKKYETIIKENEARFRALVETTSDWIWEVDQDLAYTYVSPKIYDLIGYEPEEVVAKTLFEFMSTAEADRVLEMLSKYVALKKPFLNLEHICRHKDGQDVSIESNGVPIIGDDGSLLGYRGVNRDVTERTKRTAELKKLWIAVENTPSSIAITNHRAIIEYINPGFCNVTGYSREEAIGKNPRILKSTQHDDSFYREMWSTLSSGHIWRGEICNRKKNGKLFWEDVSIAPIVDKTNKITHYVAVKTDITDKKELENQREDIERILRHDLKTPLNGIIGFPQLLLKSNDLTERQAGYCRIIEESGRRMLDMIDLYLDMIKMESGTYETSLAKINIIETINSIITDLQPQANTKKIDILCTIRQEPVEPAQIVRINGEELLCYTALSNLVKNAVEASPKNCNVFIDIEPFDSTVSIRIKNQGTVPEDLRIRFFEKYATSSKKHGTGLGTYSAKLMIEAQGGSIAMKTSTEEGTVLTVTLQS